MTLLAGILLGLATLLGLVMAIHEQRREQRLWAEWRRDVERAGRQ